MCLLKESCSRDSAETQPDDQLDLPCTPVIQSPSYKSEWAVEVQEAELTGGEVLAFLNPIEGVQSGLETCKLSTLVLSNTRKYLGA